MIILLTLTAIVITGMPLAAVVLVTVASRREEAARSIAGRAPGPMERAARRLLAFHATGIGHPAYRARARSQDRLRDQPLLGGPALADGGPALADDPAADDDLMLAGGA